MTRESPIERGNERLKRPTPNATGRFRPPAIRPFRQLDGMNPPHHFVYCAPRPSPEITSYVDVLPGRMRVSVIGGSTTTDEEYDLAVALGRELGSRGHEVVCGGLTGVMEGVARGMSETAEGRTIGILPSEDRSAANPYVDTVIATGLGNARNVLVVLNGDAAIAVNGGTGTLSEIAHALDMGRPVAGLDTHDVDGVFQAQTPEAAIEYVEAETHG